MKRSIVIISIIVLSGAHLLGGIGGTLRSCFRHSFPLVYVPLPLEHATGGMEGARKAVWVPMEMTTLTLPEDCRGGLFHCHYVYHCIIWCLPSSGRNEGWRWPTIEAAMQGGQWCEEQKVMRNSIIESSPYYRGLCFLLESPSILCGWGFFSTFPKWHRRVKALGAKSC